MASAASFSLNRGLPQVLELVKHSDRCKPWGPLTEVLRMPLNATTALTAPNWGCARWKAGDEPREPKLSSWIGVGGSDANGAIFGGSGRRPRRILMQLVWRTERGRKECGRDDTDLLLVCSSKGSRPRNSSFSMASLHTKMKKPVEKTPLRRMKALKRKYRRGEPDAEKGLAR
eukprot:scaffold36980_cov29-Tisochrysis_lutea.AAC.2